MHTHTHMHAHTCMHAHMHAEKNTHVHTNAYAHLYHIKSSAHVQTQTFPQACPQTHREPFPVSSPLHADIDRACHIPAPALPLRRERQTTSLSSWDTVEYCTILHRALSKSTKVPAKHFIPCFITTMQDGGRGVWVDSYWYIFLETTCPEI